MEATHLETIDVLGIPCAVGDLHIAARATIDRALVADAGYGVFCNVHLLMTAQHEPGVKDALDGAWLVFPDGAPVAWLQRRLGVSGAQRVGGPDLMLEVLDVGREHEIRHMLFGSTPEVVEELQQRLVDQFPGVRFVDAHAPAPGHEDSAECLDRLREARADIIWCALGAPKQELWMRRTAPILGSSLLLGVGAAFDFHSGTKNRAPLWMRNAGMEWFHRLLSEPRRLSRRYFVTNTQFAIHAGRALLAGRVRSRGCRG